MSKHEGDEAGDVGEGGAAQALDAEGLIAAFGVHLAHLSEFKGLRYVPGARMPIATPGRDAAAVESELRHEVAVSPERDAQSSGVEPAAAREDVAAVQKRVIRQQAKEWTPTRKLDYLREKVVGDCTRCPLSRTRTKLVFGVGNPEARVMFVGEAPGRDEDLSGEPFVGAAGRRLDRWIDGLGLSRADVYIANVLKCRPPGNRDPDHREVATCSPFLHAQVRAIQPKVIVALGRFAGNLMIGRASKMYEMRGSVHEYVDPKNELRVPVIVTYHPSYVLRREGEEGRAPSRAPVGGGANSSGVGAQTNDRNDRKSADEMVLQDLERARSILSA